MFYDSFRFEKLKLNKLKVSRNIEAESKIFPFKHFHDSPKRVFYFRVVRESVFSFFLSSLLANEQILIKQKSFR